MKLCSVEANLGVKFSQQWWIQALSGVREKRVGAEKLQRGLFESDNLQSESG